jgi:transposase
VDGAAFAGHGDRARSPRSGSWPTSTIGHGNRYVARVLGEAVTGAARTNTFLGARYRRLARRRGKKKAVVAVGRSILIAIWHLLADPEAHVHDLGPDHYEGHRTTTNQRRNAVATLESLGYTVTLEQAA